MFGFKPSILKENRDMNSKFLTAILTACGMLSFNALADPLTGYSGSCGATDTDCHYDITDGVLTISGNGAITSTPWRNINGYQTDITSVNVQTGITSIGANAFRGMSGITGELKIPDSVTSIGTDAFLGMSGITGELKIPDGVTSIGNGAFKGMSGITGELKIPDGVTSIGNAAFKGMSGITGELKIPDGVTSIGSDAFGGMSGVTGELKIPDGVTSIGNAAFSGMSGVTGELKIPQGVTEIRDYAFSGMSGVTGELKIPDSVTSIGSDAFYGMRGVTSLIIPDGIEEIGQYAFYNVSVSNLVCSEENLLKYINASGALKSDAKIICTSGDCENALKGTKYEALIENIDYPVREVSSADGSTAIYKHGKLVGFKNKRIYTVDEAAMLSKPTGNKFKVRYK